MIRQLAIMGLAVMGLASVPAQATATYMNFDKYGYNSQSHGRGRFSVSYFGKPNTSGDGVTNELILRLAQLCQKKGFSHYKLIGHEKDTAYKTRMMGGMKNTDKSNAYPYEYVAAYCLKDAEAESLSVEDTINSISKLITPKP